MNNTKSLAIVAVLIAATLVVGVTFAATTPTASAAYGHKKGDKKDDKRDANGNTVTAQINKQKGYVSGFDNTLEQEAQNVICTHPSSTCVSEGSETNATDTTDDGDDGHGHPGS
jgi:hypothetical protein